MGSDDFHYVEFADSHDMEFADSHDMELAVFPDIPDMELADFPDMELTCNPQPANMDLDDMEKLIQSTEQNGFGGYGDCSLTGPMISPTGLQPEASNVPTLISPEPNNAKPAHNKNFILIEKEVIVELSRRGFTVKQAALLLLVSRSTLKRRCKDYGITDWRSDRKKNGGTANKEIQLEYTMRVKGEELKVMFPVNSNTPLETLRKNLKIRLDELHPREEGQRIRVRIISDGNSSS